jgi:hypothetical protein
VAIGRQTSVLTGRMADAWDGANREIGVPQKKQIDLEMFLGYSMYALAKFR